MKLRLKFKRRWIALILILILPILFLAQSAQFFPDIIVTSKSGIWTDTRAYASITAAMTAIGATACDVYITRSEACVALTIPSTVRLHFLRSGAIANTGQLTIQTTHIFAGAQQIFTGAGDIDFADSTNLKLSWFATAYAAFNLTSDDNITIEMNDARTLGTTVALGNGVTLRWDSPGNVLTSDAAVDFTNIKNISAGHYQVFGGSGDFDFRDGTVLNSSWFTSIYAANGYIASDGVELVVDQDETIASNVTIASPVKVSVLPACLITVNNAITLTLSSPAIIIARPNQQIFSLVGTGIVAFSTTGIAESNWWGTTGTAIEYASAAVGTGGGVHIVPGIYEDVTVDEDDRTLIISEGVMFRSSNNSLTPALLFDSCDRVSVIGRIVANGNKTNQAGADLLTELNIGYEYATVSFYNCTYLSIGDVYTYDAWHDGVCIDSCTFSTFGGIVVKDAGISCGTTGDNGDGSRSVLMYGTTQDCFVNSIIATGTSTTRAFRHGGADIGHIAARNSIGSIHAYNIADGVYVESMSRRVVIGEILVERINFWNGVKIDDCSYVNVGTIHAYDCGAYGLVISSGSYDSQNISVGSVQALACASNVAGSYAGVCIASIRGHITQFVQIGQIISQANSNGTYGSGVRIQTTNGDPGSSVKYVNIGQIIASSNKTHGVYVDAGDNTIENINLGDIIATGNGTVNFRVEHECNAVTWGKVITDAAGQEGEQNQLAAFGRTGLDQILEADYTLSSSSGSAATTLKGKYIGSGVLGATGGLHIFASGVKGNAATERKDIIVSFGNQQITLINDSETAEDWRIDIVLGNASVAAQRVSWVAYDGDVVSSGNDVLTVDTALETLTSGTVTVDQYYRITNYVGGDDFTNIGAAANATGVEFLATGTTPASWLNGSSLLRVATYLRLIGDNDEGSTDVISCTMWMVKRL